MSCFADTTLSLIGPESFNCLAIIGIQLLKSACATCAVAIVAVTRTSPRKISDFMLLRYGIIPALFKND
jgi:hypothetical protein